MSKPLVIVTRRLPDVIETRMMELFNSRLNLDDEPMSQAQLIEAVKVADVLVHHLKNALVHRLSPRSAIRHLRPAKATRFLHKPPPSEMTPRPADSSLTAVSSAASARAASVAQSAKALPLKTRIAVCAPDRHYIGLGDIDGT